MSKNTLLNSFSKEKLINIHHLVTLSRLLDEHLIHIYKKGQGYFWIGSPGEEIFSVCLGLLVDKGQGLNHDWLHLHYRCTPTLVAMGLSTKDSIRMMMSKKADPCTGGRNFANHYCFPKWNVPPITSIIEMQYSIAIGTAHAQSRNPSKGISIVTGGDAGTALGDFSTSLVWASKPSRPLPLLNIVLNNKWGISTDYKNQHGESAISDRAKSFNIKTFSTNGNDLLDSYFTLKEALSYVRKNRKPAMIEAHVSRLYGHSSASGANFVAEEECCLQKLESELLKNKIIKQKDIQNIREEIKNKLIKETKEVEQELDPEGKSIWSHVYANGENADWRKF